MKARKKMKKEFRTVDEKKGIVQITTSDDRWYAFPCNNGVSGLPEYKFVPSVTWICEHYPKGIAFYKWLANHGWDEAEALKIAAGDKGSKVHYAIGDLLDGKSVKIDGKYLNPTSGQSEELTVDEYECVLSFVGWYETVKPKIIAIESVVVNQQEDYAGTIDLICEIASLIYIVDFKSSQYIWPSHELQLSAYAHAPLEHLLPGKPPIKMAILQIGYRRNKNRYKFTEIEDKYDEFLAAKVIWQNETKGISPSQKDYPLSIKLKKEKQNEHSPN
jgi:hypothetical protein